MEKTQKFAAYFTEGQKDKIDRCQDMDGSRSAAEVVRNAVDFYYGYLTADNAGLFLPQALQSYLDGRLNKMEDRLSALSFKHSVEVDMMAGILADSFQFTEEGLRRRRAESVGNVKRTNGRISFEKRVRDAADYESDDREDNY